MRFSKFLLGVVVLLISSIARGQDCSVKNKMRPDGSIYYFMDPVLFFNTAENKIYGGVMTDKESYFLTITPRPFPPKSKKDKLDQDLLITLSDGKEYKLEHYDSQYIEDTTLVISYVIGKDALPAFREQDIETVKFNMGKEKGEQTFQFRLHKSALKQQILCLTDKKN
jgi:hypothetical protein